MSRKTIYNRMSDELKVYKDDVKRYKKLDSFALPEPHNNAVGETSKLEYNNDNSENITDHDILEDLLSSSNPRSETQNISGLIVSAEYSSNEEVEETSSSIISDNLSKWALRNTVSHSNITDLLKVLNESGLKNLPKSAKKLLKIRKKPANNQDFQNLILEKLKDINRQLAENKKTQQFLLEKFTKFEAEYKANQMADNKLTRNCLVLLKRVSTSIDSLTGAAKDDIEEEVIAFFPLRTMAELSDIELRLQDPAFATAAVGFLKKRLLTQSLELVFRSVMEDILIFNFNLDGRCGKRKLMALQLFDSVLCKSCGADYSRKDYESELRSCILRAHNRHNRAKCLANKKHRASIKIDKCNLQHSANEESESI